MSEELKPCPFCGREDLVKLHMEGTVLHPAYKINCEFCGASTSYTDKDCSLDWNKRTIEDALRTENEQLTKELEEIKLALQVEEHDNEYNCAEKDKLKAENARFRDALVDISHGCLVPPDGGSPTFDDLVDCARKALAPQIEGN